MERQRTSSRPYADPVQQTLAPDHERARFSDGDAAQRFVIEDDGFNAVECAAGLFNGASGVGPSCSPDRAGRGAGLRNVMVWPGAGGDASDGKLTSNILVPAVDRSSISVGRSQFRQGVEPSWTSSGA
jgi:hypothetical protein